MHYVKNKIMLVHAFVYQNIMEILTKDVDLNVWLIQIVMLTKRAWQTSVKTHVQELVAVMLNVKLLITYQCAHVYLVMLEIHLNTVKLYNRNVSINNKTLNVISLKQITIFDLTKNFNYFFFFHRS